MLYFTVRLLSGACPARSRTGMTKLDRGDARSPCPITDGGHRPKHGDAPFRNCPGTGPTPDPIPGPARRDHLMNPAARRTFIEFGMANFFLFPPTAGYVQ